MFIGKLESEMKTAEPRGSPLDFIPQLIPKVNPESGATSSSGVIAPSSSESIQELLDVVMKTFLDHSKPELQRFNS